MSEFERVHEGRNTGTLTMFDRLIFKGHLTRFFHPGAIRAFLWSQGTPLTEFGRYAKGVTEMLVNHAERVAAEAGRPSIYLRNAVTRDGGQTKEELARSIAARDGVTEGLVCGRRAPSSPVTASRSSTRTAGWR